MLRNYYVQILTYIAMINNNISSYYMSDDTIHKSLSGRDGWPNWYHYWIMLDYRSQLIIYLIGIFLALKYPLKDEYKSFAIKSIFLYIMVFVCEIGVYLWYGNDSMNERLYYYYLGIYTVGLYVIAIKERAWML